MQRNINPLHTDPFSSLEEKGSYEEGKIVVVWFQIFNLLFLMEEREKDLGGPRSCCLLRKLN
jgi:hypothetical protein